MNTKRSFEEKYRFCFSKPINLKPQWVVGFIDAEGNFFNKLSLRHKGGYNYIETESTLSIGQNIHDIGVLLAITKFFGDSGWIKPKLDDYTNYGKINKISSSGAAYCNSKPSTFIPILDQYSLFTSKQLDYIDFKKFLALKEAKAYKTKEGLKEMENIVLGMNSGRYGNSKRRPRIS
jgi:hypothetical protein